ncbi:hypothetical protein GVAV_001682 [Gurleya vavrai]
MNRKKTLGGSQKLSFAPKKPVESDFVAPSIPIKPIISKKKERDRKIESKQDVTTFAALKKEEAKSILMVEYDDTEDFILHDEMVQDFFGDENLGFMNEKMVLISGYENGEFYVKNDGELFYEENGKFCIVNVNLIEELSVVNICENVNEIGKVKKCYNICRNIN